VTIGSTGDNLVFLISQPRAGSTLLQRMLGSHPDIHTVAEPWLMLHPLYAFREQGYAAEYEAPKAQAALRTFLQTLPRGEEEYRYALRKMYVHLYGAALAGSNGQLFLDKTPRYYLIIPELYQTFPDARFIILLRNPLAVLVSILAAWTRWSLLSLHKYKEDLLRGPVLMLEGLEVLGDEVILIRYECLVQDAEVEVRRICDSLQIEFAPEILDYGQHGLPYWSLGDQQGVYEQTRPSALGADKWINALDDPQIWRLARDYLHALGPLTVERMGYSYQEMCQVLDARHPSKIKQQLTFSLDWLLEKPIKERGWCARSTVWLTAALRERGTKSTIIAGAKKVKHALSRSS
jgi:hypothetical protein